MLHNLGEIAFWSMGGPITEQLDASLRQNPAAEKELVRDLLGTSFTHFVRQASLCLLLLTKSQQN